MIESWKGSGHTEVVLLYI